MNVCSNPVSAYMNVDIISPSSSICVVLVSHTHVLRKLKYTCMIIRHEQYNVVYTVKWVSFHMKIDLTQHYLNNCFISKLDFVLFSLNREHHTNRKKESDNGRSKYK